MITKSQSENMLVEHRHAGNGWAVIQWLPDDACRVVGCGAGLIGRQAFLAWTKALSIETRLIDPSNPKSKRVASPIPPDVLPQIESLRKEIESGERTIVNARFVPPLPEP